MAQASGTGRGQVRCQYHPDAHLAEDYRAGDMICTECGLVVGDRVIDVGRYVHLHSLVFHYFSYLRIFTDYFSEWRTFSNDKGKLLTIIFKKLSKIFFE